MENQIQRQNVHPVAKWVAGLYSPMSLKDQRMVASGAARTLYGSLLISLILGYVMGLVYITFYGVTAGFVVSLLLYVPNWYQREDDDQRWCDESEVKEYYRLRQELLDQMVKEQTQEEIDLQGDNQQQAEEEKNK
ncbi:Microsomal signal peptidase 12kDa subunit [Trypanosoma melophagium]|uniref:Microsomal signal peptidase 12kDa subunit n=1 Tax=Trypanosoma melophagium TaxID=715481 RepID=UPI00351A7934|nr:Microsomal signal peptidase 12kDa subunit [Trypanosoma melophagium]